MSNFLKVFFGSCLGVIVGLVVLFFIGFGMIASLASSAEQKPTVSANSILEIDLAQVPELTNNIPSSGGFADLELDPDPVLGVHDIIRAIEKAKTDDNIKGIYFSSIYAAGGPTKLRQVREAIEDFKSDGKFVVSFSPVYDQSAYYLASAGSEVYLGPLGILDMRGLSAERMFYKGMMDKIGLKMNVFYAGDFKSATEPFRRKDMSEQSKLQTREYVTEIWNAIKGDVAEARGLTPEEVHQYANEMTGWKGEELLQTKLIDGVMRRSEVDARLHELVGFEDDQKLKKIDISTYFSARLRPLKGRGDEIAVLYAEGGIVDGKGDVGSIGDKAYVEHIEKLTQDDDVKAVVLRVNSGGGSASASENIWYAMEELKAAGKPFVVSMGSVAASGGYYIAAGADSIFAEPTVITGSIGVFMMFPNAKELMQDKLGLTTDTVNVTRNANAFSPYRDLTPEEENLLKQRTTITYNTFLERVAEGRDMPVEQVKELAGGRVYGGNRALEIGLVDRLAGLDAAINSAAGMAGLTAEDYTVGEYPRIKPPLERLLEDLLGEDAIGGGFTEATLREQLGDKAYQHYKMWRETTQMRTPQAR
ncbi:MAG: signal peptide peptidase SppA, partial [Bacteroidota bacterium]